MRVNTLLQLKLSLIAAHRFRDVCLPFSTRAVPKITLWRARSSICQFQLVDRYQSRRTYMTRS
jgi:hypothetical protein